MITLCGQYAAGGRVLGALAIGLVLADNLVFAQAARPLILWQTLHAGMTKEEVKAAQPEKLIRLGPGCSGVLAFSYTEKRLSKVVIDSSLGNDENAQCGALVLKSLASKYGKPIEDTETKEARYCGSPYARGLQGALVRLCLQDGGNLPIIKHAIRWENDGLEVFFAFTEGEGSVWKVTYRAASAASATAAGKL